MEDSAQNKLQVPHPQRSKGVDRRDSYDTPGDHTDFAIGTIMLGTKSGFSGCFQAIVAPRDRTMWQ